VSQSTTNEVLTESQVPGKVKPRLSSEEWVLVSLLGIYLLTVIWGLLADGTWDDDCVDRYYNTRQAFDHPKHFIGLWNRPLFVLLFALPVLLSKYAIITLMPVVSIITNYALYRAAKLQNIRNAYLVIPFLTFQAFYFPISFSALAEPLAACIMALGLLFYLEKKYVAFVIVGSLLPLARLELSPLLVFWLIILIQQKQWKIIPLLIVPTLLWNFAGTYFTGDPIWLYSQTFGQGQTANRYGQTSFWSYFQRYIFVVGPVVFYFFLIGLFEKIYQRRVDLFVSIQFLVGFFIYVVFSWKLSLGQAAGFLRHLISLSPLVAYLALNGFNQWFNSIHEKKARIRTLIGSIIILILTYVFLSEKLIIHHLIIPEADYANLLVISTLLLFFIGAIFFRKSIKVKTLLRYVVSTIIVLTIGYTLVTEPPDKNNSEEREIMKLLSDWYIEHDVYRFKTYANHGWFYYANTLDRSSDRFGQVTMANLEAAPDSAVVIWENHYSQRLRGDVPLDSLRNNPRFEELLKLTSHETKFNAIVFQVIN